MINIYINKKKKHGDDIDGERDAYTLTDYSEPLAALTELKVRLAEIGRAMKVPPRINSLHPVEQHFHRPVSFWPVAASVS